jgi:squalene-hopene/tetraprenyl-beta-curcumene cyclase
VSTSLLVYAALNLYASEDHQIDEVHAQLANYLLQRGVDVTTSQVARSILTHYSNDYTFSVPILTMCGLCGVPGDDAFNHIPQLPFELSLLPRHFYRMLNLSVVSYAIPALVAVGIVIFKKKKSNLFWRIVRKFSIGKAINILHRMLPESGGYLEAIPLTAFVALSLINSGFAENEVVKKGVQFLKKTQREDGGWPIDVDLSTWVTSLSVKAFRGNLNGFINSDEQDNIADHYRWIQNKTVHPFNGTKPGGWGWTYFSGSVPDGDDTPGAILALLKLQPKEKIRTEIFAAVEWLKQLQNSDGGFPTFSKGWGKLPFDQSCSDLTGHALLAVSAVAEEYLDTLKPTEKRMLEAIFGRALNYLESAQAKDGSWLPLWFGNQQTPDHKNPVYGTARVLTYLKDAIAHKWHNPKTQIQLTSLIEKATTFLVSAQNADGSWGGEKNIEGSMEETALAVSALASQKNIDLCNSGLKWMKENYRKHGFKPAPIGLYFASLWYDEKLYPITACLEALVRMDEITEL